MINDFPEKNSGYTYVQPNRGDQQGNLWSTMGLDFQTNLGVMRVAPRLKINTSTTDDADLGLPVAIKYFATRIWAICDTHIFVTPVNQGEPQITFLDDTSTNAQTDYSKDVSDLEVFNNRLWGTTVDSLWSIPFGSTTWTSRDTLETGVSHMQTYFQKFNRLYYLDSVNGDGVISIDTSDVVSALGTDYTIELFGKQQTWITSIKASSNYIWIGTINRASRGARGAVYQWDGISAQATNKFLLDAQGCNAILIDNDIPYIMDTNAVLSKFTGYAFEEIGRLPAPIRLKGSANDTNSRFIHPNGLAATKNGTILALINNENQNNSATIQENLPSGIWEWSEDFGFTHKYAFTYNPATTSTITDFGQNRISAVGALSPMNVPSTTAGYNGSLMAGATLFTNASSTNSVIALDDFNDTVQKRGYFTTQWIDSEEVEDKWDRLWVIFKRLLNSGDRMVFKYRLTEVDPTYATITWTSTTTFTTTTDVSAYGPTATGFDGVTGGEVEVIQGTGSAVVAHITNISESGGTYTVTIDETATGVTNGTAKARFQKWIKVFPEITYTVGAVRSWEQMGIGANNTEIQIRGCFLFTGADEFSKFALFSNSDITIAP